MPVFSYTVANRSGKVTKGSSHAADERSLEQLLEREGKLLIEVLKSDEASRKTLRSGRVRRGELIEMAYHLSIICQAGIPILSGLEDFKDQRASPRMKRILEEVLEDVNAGLLLSEALARHPKAFGEIFINLVRAGEASGSLDVVMERLYKEMEWQSGIRNQLVQAMIYPIILILALSGLVILLLTFLLPRVLGLFPAGTLDLPLPTKILLFVSGLLQSHWPLLLGGILGLAAGIHITRQFSPGRYLIDKMLIQLPLLGGVILDIAIARFFSTFRTLFASGVEVLRAIEISGKSSGNNVINARAQQMHDNISKGSLLSEAVNKVDEFDSMIRNLVNMGEKSGQTAMTMEKITGYFDTVIPRRVKRMISIMEPAIIILAGLLVGFVLVGTLLPVFNLYSTL